MIFAYSTLGLRQVQINYEAIATTNGTYSSDE